MGERGEKLAAGGQPAQQTGSAETPRLGADAKEPERREVTFDTGMDVVFALNTPR